MQERKEKLVLHGHFKLITELTEFRMSMWVNGFGLSNALTGNIVIPLILSFNLDDLQEHDDVLVIRFRIYPDGLKSYQVKVNPLLKTFIYEDKTYQTDFFSKLLQEKNLNKV